MAIKKFNLKLLIGTFTFVMMVLIDTTGVYAVSGSYSTTYNMTGGVYSSQNWNATNMSTFKIKTTPTVGYDHIEIVQYLERKTFAGWTDVNNANVPSKKSSSSSLTGDKSGEYRIYFRNYSGVQIKGNFSISYSW